MAIRAKCCAALAGSPAKRRAIQPAWNSASIRFSGVSISYALGAILGGAFAPLIAAALVKATGGTGAVTVYLAVMTLVGLAATLLLRDRTGIPLGPDHEAEQSVSPIYGVSRA